MYENIKYNKPSNSKIKSFALFFGNILRKWDALSALYLIILILVGESEPKTPSRGRSENHEIRSRAELGNSLYHGNPSSSSGQTPSLSKIMSLINDQTQASTDDNNHESFISPSADNDYESSASPSSNPEYHLKPGLNRPTPPTANLNDLMQASVYDVDNFLSDSGLLT